MQERAEAADPTPSQPTERRARAFDPSAFLREWWRLLAVVATLAIGIVFVLLGWYGAAHTNIITEQIPYLISGGLLGLGLIIVSGLMASSWVSERQSAELRRQIARALASTQRVTDPAAFGGGDQVANGVVFVVPGGKSYHVAGCPIVEGKEGVRDIAPADAASSGLAACKLCGSD